MALIFNGTPLAGGKKIYLDGVELGAGKKVYLDGVEAFTQFTEWTPGTVGQDENVLLFYWDATGSTYGGEGASYVWYDTNWNPSSDHNFPDSGSANKTYAENLYDALTSLYGDHYNLFASAPTESFEGSTTVVTFTLASDFRISYVDMNTSDNGAPKTDTDGSGTGNDGGTYIARQSTSSTGIEFDTYSSEYDILGGLFGTTPITSNLGSCVFKIRYVPQET